MVLQSEAISFFSFLLEINMIHDIIILFQDSYCFCLEIHPTHEFSFLSSKTVVALSFCGKEIHSTQELVFIVQDTSSK